MAQAICGTIRRRFPFFSVRDKSEYEVCRIIQECCERNTKYTVASDVHSVTGA